RRQGRLSVFNERAQETALADEVLLADKFPERARPHTLRQRSPRARLGAGGRFRLGEKIHGLP
ncbi:MAG: hypothetical protein WKF30_18130, partial [Pyrinomonadaceae bacterium]